MNQEIKSKLLQILNEELSNIMQEAEPSSLGKTDYATLSDSLAETASKLDAETKDYIDGEIDYALNIGNTSIDYNYYTKNPVGFTYFTDALATIVKQGGENSENAKKALMTVFSPYSKQSSTKLTASGEREVGKQKMSDFFVRINRFAANHIDLKGQDALYFINDMNTDNLLDAFYKGFENAIKFFNPEFKKSFNSLISTAIANAKIDIWRKQNQYTSGGQKVMKQTTSLDKPLDADDTDAGTLGDTIASNDTGTERMMDKNRAKKIWRAIDTFIKRAINFSYPDNPKYEQVYDMYTNHDMDLEEIAKALDVENGTVRIMKMRAEDSVKDFIEDGTLAQFVMQTTGEKIKDIPFVQGKGSSKMRFVFPRVKDSLKENINNIFENIIVLGEGEFSLNTTSFYKEEELPDWIEYSNLVLQESNQKLKLISKIYNQFNEVTKTLNEAYDGNYNIDVMDLFEQVKGFVEESRRIITALYNEVYKLENVAFSVHKEYPGVAQEINNTVKPIIEKLEEWPNKLSFMLQYVRNKYNPKNAFGI